MCRETIAKSIGDINRFEKYVISLLDNLEKKRLIQSEDIPFNAEKIDNVIAKDLKSIVSTGLLVLISVKRLQSLYKDQDQSEE